MVQCLFYLIYLLFFTVKFALFIIIYFSSWLLDCYWFLDWTPAEEDATDVNVWEDNWDDDQVEDDFSEQLRCVVCYFISHI